MGGKAKTEKMSVTLPRELVGEIRSIASHGEISSLFAEALEHYLAYRKQKVALEEGFGAWKNDSHSALAISEDSTAYVRAIREADGGRQNRVRGVNAK